MFDPKEEISITLTREAWFHIACAINVYRQEHEPFNPMTGEKINYDHSYNEIYNKACPKDIQEQQVSKVHG